MTYEITAGGLVGDDGLTGALTRAVGEDVGTYAIQQGTLTAGGNYELTFVGANLTITAAQLTVTGITAADKVYDGTTEATQDVSQAVLVGVIGSDDVTLDTSEAVGAFEDPGVGSDKTVFVSGLVISGGDAGNYSLTQPTTTASILAIDGTRIAMTIVRDPSATEANGKVAALPGNTDWVHEWESFWVEIWVSTPGSTTLGVAEATVDLQYHNDYLTALEIEYGLAFSHEPLDMGMWPLHQSDGYRRVG